MVGGDVQCWALEEKCNQREGLGIGWREEEASSTVSGLVSNEGSNGESLYLNSKFSPTCLISSV